MSSWPGFSCSICSQISFSDCIILFYIWSLDCCIWSVSLSVYSFVLSFCLRIYLDILPQWRFPFLHCFSSQLCLMLPFYVYILYKPFIYLLILHFHIIVIIAVKHFIFTSHLGLTVLTLTPQFSLIMIDSQIFQKFIIQFKQVALFLKSPSHLLWYL